MKKENIKSITLFLLIIIIIIFTQYIMQANSIIKSNSERNINYFRNEIINLNDNLSKKDNMTWDELKEVLRESKDSGILQYAEETYLYTRINRLEYMDISYFNHYIGFLIGGELPEEEAIFHKNNIEKICELWCDIDSCDNTFYPTKEIKEACIKTNEISSDGINRISEFWRKE